MKYLHFDLRALALMRLCIAAVILMDLAVRINDLEAFYADTGVIPLALLFEHGWNDYFVSLHVISGMWQVQLILFLAAALCAVFLFIGYRTRLFTFLSWLMMLSLHNRNGFILQGGDDLLRMVLFWGIFIPWGAAYSCDAIFTAVPYQPRQILTVACVAYLLQICYIYTGSALLKGSEWDHDFSAMYYVYALDQINYPLTKYFFYYPELLAKLTMAAYYFELLVPLLFFVPVKHSFFRSLGVVLIVLFHMMNSLTLFIGMFPLIGMATSLGILPSVFMDRLEKICAGIRETVRSSFQNIGKLIGKVIVWKEQVYEGPVFLQHITTAALVFLTVFVFDWNFSNLTFISSRLSDSLRGIGYALRLDQNWGMFAPGVFKDDGWFVLEGRTANNKTIDLWQPGKPIHYKKPEQVYALFKNDRWRKYSENLILSSQSYLRGYFCNYSKRIWNEAHPSDQLKSLKIIFMSEFTLPDYQYSKPEKIVLWECDGS